MADIPTVSTVGVFNLAHFRAAGVLAEAEGVSLEQADAAISAKTGRVIANAAEYRQTQMVAMEILSDHPLLVAKQAARSSLSPGSTRTAFAGGWCSWPSSPFTSLPSRPDRRQQADFGYRCCRYGTVWS